MAATEVQREANLADVLSNLKDELRYYAVYEVLTSPSSSPSANKPLTDAQKFFNQQAQNKVLLDGAAAANACGGPPPAINVDQIKVELTTKTDTTTSGELGLKVPIGSVTLGPDVSASGEGRRYRNSRLGCDIGFVAQNRIYRPARGGRICCANAGDFWGQHPIAGSIDTASHIPFDGSRGKQATLFPTGTPAGSQSPDSYAFAFQLTNTVKGTFDISFLVFSISLARQSQHVFANTITVSFKASGTAYFTQ